MQKSFSESAVVEFFYKDAFLEGFLKITEITIKKYFQKILK